MKRIWTPACTALLFLFSVTGAFAQVTDLDPTDQADSKFGQSLANVGDVNGDGYADVIVGAPKFNNAQGVTTGGAFLFLGSENGVSSTPDWSSTGEDILDSQYGSTVSAAGDVNNDGYADVLVCAGYWGENTYENEGRAYLYLGSETGLSEDADWVADPVDQNRSSGDSYPINVAGVGDVNGDGYDDVVLGAPRWSSTYPAEGRVYLYLGTGSGLSTSPEVMLDPADKVMASFGKSVASAGDVNGDGFADVVVGAFGYGDELGFDRYMGRTYVFHGSETGISSTPNWVSSGDEVENAMFGWMVDSAGDVNGDGYSDVIIGASFAALGIGKAYIYPGSSQGLSDVPVWTSTGNGFMYAISVSGLGDMNGDGYGDVVVGEPWRNGTDHNGRAFIFMGGENGPSEDADHIFSGEAMLQMFGESVSAAGDVDGDGFDDIFVGTPRWSNGSGVSEGRVSVFPGFDDGSATGTAIILSQFEADGATSLVTGAMAAEAQVALSQNLVNNGSMGGMLGIEIEIKPVGVDFDGEDTQVSEGYLTSETAIVVTSTLTAGPKHWRSRIVYPGNMGASRWISYGDNSESETDFEVPVVPTDDGTGTHSAPLDEGGNSDSGRGGRCGCTGAEAMLMMGLVVLWRRRIRRK